MTSPAAARSPAVRAAPVGPPGRAGDPATSAAADAGAVPALGEGPGDRECRRVAADAGCAARPLTGPAVASSGRTTVNAEPSPGAGSTLASPPKVRARLATMNRPRPEPPSRLDDGAPVEAVEDPLGLIGWHARHRGPGPPAPPGRPSAATRISTGVPGGVWARAFPTRLCTSCSSRRTVDRAPGPDRRRPGRWSGCRRSSGRRTTTSATTAARSTRVGSGIGPSPSRARTARSPDQQAHPGRLLLDPGQRPVPGGLRRAGRPCEAARRSPGSR